MKIHIIIKKDIEEIFFNNNYIQIKILKAKNLITYQDIFKLKAKNYYFKKTILFIIIIFPSLRSDIFLNFSFIRSYL